MRDLYSMKDVYLERSLSSFSLKYGWLAPPLYSYFMREPRAVIFWQIPDLHLFKKSLTTSCIWDPWLSSLWKMPISSPTRDPWPPLLREADKLLHERPLTIFFFMRDPWHAPLWKISVILWKMLVLRDPRSDHMWEIPDILFYERYQWSPHQLEIPSQQICWACQLLYDSLSAPL